MEKKQKRKYYLFPKEIVQWKMKVAYQSHRIGSILNDEIAQSLAYTPGANPYNFEYSLFDPVGFECINGKKKINTSKHNIYLITRAGRQEIWEIGDCAHDMDGNIIPNLYYVRQIGEVLQ